MELFSKKFKPVNTDEELISLQKSFSKYDPGYITQAAGLPRQKEKEWISALYKIFKPYADIKFCKEFERHFSQRAWELYLGATFLSRGLNLCEHNSNDPDFKIDHNNNKSTVWIEAIAVEKGKGKDKVPDMVEQTMMDFPPIEEKMLCRIGKGLDRKFKRYKKQLRMGIIKDSDPYVIAISRSMLDYVDPEYPLILKILFDKYGNHKRSSYKLSFEDTSYSGISAIIYCSKGILDASHELQELGRDFAIIYNPLAKNVLPDRFFPFGTEYK